MRARHTISELAANLGSKCGLTGQRRHYLITLNVRAAGAAIFDDFANAAWDTLSDTRGSEHEGPRQCSRGGGGAGHLDRLKLTDTALQPPPPPPPAIHSSASSSASISSSVTTLDPAATQPRAHAAMQSRGHVATQHRGLAATWPRSRVETQAHSHAGSQSCNNAGTHASRTDPAGGRQQRTLPPPPRTHRRGVRRRRASGRLRWSPSNRRRQPPALQAPDAGEGVGGGLTIPQPPGCRCVGAEGLWCTVAPALRPTCARG
jgi:hypothetical protein